MNSKELKRTAENYAGQRLSKIYEDMYYAHVVKAYIAGYHRAKRELAPTKL